MVQKIVVDENNKLKGLTVKDSGIRERWIVGERKKIQKLNTVL